MQLEEYQELAMRTNDGKCNDRLKFEVDKKYKSPNPGQLINACLGLAGEVGEINDMIKKAVYHGHELNTAELFKELGDVMWYVALMADTYGVSIDFIAEMNIDKLKKRYPQGFSEQASLNRSI